MREEHTREINKLREDLAQQAHRERLEALEAVTRDKYNDYDEVVNELVEEMQAKPYLQAEWQERGGTPEDAYTLAKELSALRTGSLSSNANNTSLKRTTMAGKKKVSTRRPAEKHEFEYSADSDPLDGIIAGGGDF